jgi:hypothetical protein
MSSVDDLIQLANKSPTTQREELWLLSALNAWIGSAPQWQSAFEDEYVKRGGTASPNAVRVVSVLGACEGSAESGRLRALVTACDPAWPHDPQAPWPSFDQLVELALTVPTDSAAIILRMREHSRRSEPQATRCDRLPTICS